MTMKQKIEFQPSDRAHDQSRRKLFTGHPLTKRYLLKRYQLTKLNHFTSLYPSTRSPKTSLHLQPILQVAVRSSWCLQIYRTQPGPKPTPCLACYSSVADVPVQRDLFPLEHSEAMPQRPNFHEFHGFRLPCTAFHPSRQASRGSVVVECHLSRDSRADAKPTKTEVRVISAGRSLKRMRTERLDAKQFGAKVCTKSQTLSSSVLRFRSFT